jgi:outer membrane protein assembly factor BamB
MYLSESVTYAEDGDLIVSCADFTTARIDRETGDTVWTTPRVWPVSGSADLTVSGDRFYGFGGALVGGGLKVYAFDLATGARLDSVEVEDTHPGGTAPYGNIIAGPDGALYAHRCGDNVTAIEDHRDSLHIRWVHEVSADPAALWAQLACGPDSSVYALSNGRVVRLDHETGAAIDSSQVIKDPTATFSAHLAVDAGGRVYATNGGYAGGALYCFDPDLRLVAVDSIFNVSTSNPAISDFGFLAIAGGGTLLKVYDSPNAVAERPARRLAAIRARPSPFRTSVHFSLSTTGPLEDLSTRPLQVFAASGRLVRTLVPRPSSPVPLTWDGRDDAGRVVPAGTYFCRAGDEGRALMVIKQ